MRIDPAIGGFERARSSAPYTERFRQGIVGVDKAAGRKFGGFPSALVAADAVSDGGDNVAVGYPGLTEANADIVFIARSLAGFADETDTNLKISLRTDRHPRTYKKAAARVVRPALPMRRPTLCASGP